ncbi:predicted protein [Coccidioides posadasii str. Silveira]|uniref:Predicted protein n=1 Tax=Coccidioides posadasii (strain RMSCC 757 / Silveira) TaxID=443226 RepID=E9CSL3_COCPS|nr:predicted protein [Coccidioides posadasii str. Silveira]
MVKKFPGIQSFSLQTQRMPEQCYQENPQGQGSAICREYAPSTPESPAIRVTWVDHMPSFTHADHLRDGSPGVRVPQAAAKRPLQSTPTSHFPPLPIMALCF